MDRTPKSFRSAERKQQEQHQQRTFGSSEEDSGISQVSMFEHQANLAICENEE